MSPARGPVRHVRDQHPWGCHALAASTAGTVAPLESQPDAKEIQVERVKFLRYGEARGDYDQVVETLNVSDPHGK